MGKSHRFPIGSELGMDFGGFGVFQTGREGSARLFSWERYIGDSICHS